MWNPVVYVAAAWAAVTAVLLLALFGVTVAERVGILHPATAPLDLESLVPPAAAAPAPDAQRDETPAAV